MTEETPIGKMAARIGRIIDELPSMDEETKANSLKLIKNLAGEIEQESEKEPCAPVYLQKFARNGKALGKPEPLTLVLTDV